MYRPPRLARNQTNGTDQIHYSSTLPHDRCLKDVGRARQDVPGFDGIPQTVIKLIEVEHELLTIAFKNPSTVKPELELPIFSVFDKIIPEHIFVCKKAMYMSPGPPAT